MTPLDNTIVGMDVARSFDKKPRTKMPKLNLIGLPREQIDAAMFTVLMWWCRKEFWK